MLTTRDIQKVHLSHLTQVFLTPKISNMRSPDHNPLHHAAHYLKNAVTLETSSDEKRRESAVADHAHVNDHGGRQAEDEFWEKHRKGGGVGESGLKHAEGHGKVQKVVDKVRPGDGAAREGGSMVG
jgi:hypothetical protein